MQYLSYLYDVFVYDLYEKYDTILAQKDCFSPASLTATNGYV
jgi:hypothetical protein